MMSRSLSRRNGMLFRHLAIAIFQTCIAAGSRTFSRWLWLTAGIIWGVVLAESCALLARRLNGDPD
jgi:hypothetical protein